VGVALGSPKQEGKLMLNNVRPLGGKTATLSTHRIFFYNNAPAKAQTKGKYRHPREEPRTGCNPPFLKPQSTQPTKKKRGRKKIG